MAQACLRCLKFTMCAANFLCFMCGIGVLGFGIYLTIQMAEIPPFLSSFKEGQVLTITGIIITCVSFLGFLGALRENRCLLLTFFLLLFIMMLVELSAACLLLLYEKEISQWLETELRNGLNDAKGKAANDTLLLYWDEVQQNLKCCGVINATDWETNVPRSCCDGQCTTPPKYYTQGCFDALKAFFENNFLITGIAVIVLCIVEVLGMCFAMTLFCHISRTGLGYRL